MVYQPIYQDGLLMAVVPADGPQAWELSHLIIDVELMCKYSGHKQCCLKLTYPLE